jgi:hypothetical protein
MNYRYVSPIDAKSWNSRSPKEAAGDNQMIELMLLDFSIT